MQKMTMIRFLSFSATAVGLLALSACSGLGVTTGSGVLKTESRSVSGFSSIQLQTSGSLTIEQTGTESLTIEAEDNILPLLTSEVVNGRLVLGAVPNSSFNTTKGIDYRITVSNLDQVVISGSGNADVKPINSTSFNVEIGGSGNIMFERLDGLQQFSVNIGGSGDVTVNALTTQTATINISGSGDVNLSGTGSSQLVSIRGNGSYNGENLITQVGQVNIGGSGNVTINASQTLDVLIDGSGSITYLGDPQVNSQINGSGRISKR